MCMRNNQITFHRFLTLKQDDQDQILFDQGIFLLKRSLGKRTFALYAVEKFFVELEYYKTNIIRKQAFVAGLKLDEYAPLDSRRILNEF